MKKVLSKTDDTKKPLLKIFTRCENVISKSEKSQKFHFTPLHVEKILVQTLTF